MEWRTRPASHEGQRWRGWLGRAVDLDGRSLKTKLTAGARCQRRREWRRGCAQRAWAGLRAEFQAARCTVVFPFSFFAVFALCLILHIKLCTDSKIMEIFV